MFYVKIVLLQLSNDNYLKFYFDFNIVALPNRSKTFVVDLSALASY